MLYSLPNQAPTLAESCFVAPSADLIGGVFLAEESSVWFGAVLRADNETIEIGEGSNVQDSVVIHADPGFPCKVGANCVIGHRAVLHGCTICKNSLVGIGAIVLNGAIVEENCLIGAGALVAEGKVLESGHLYMGIPAKKIRPLTNEEITSITRNAEGYRARARHYSKLKSL